MSNKESSAFVEKQELNLPQPAPRIENVSDKHRPEVVGFPFDRARGGLLLVMYDQNGDFLQWDGHSGRVQVRDRQQARAVVGVAKPASWELFTEADLFGEGRISCISTTVPGYSITVKLDVAGYHDSGSVLPAAQWRDTHFIVDTGASHTLLFVTKPVFDRIGTVKTKAGILAFPLVEETLANGSRASVRKINFAVRVSNAVMCVSEGSVMPFPPDAAEAKRCQHLLGMDILKQCVLTLAGESFTLFPVFAVDEGQFVQW